jgi:hypothetical protein
LYCLGCTLLIRPAQFSLLAQLCFGAVAGPAWANIEQNAVCCYSLLDCVNAIFFLYFLEYSVCS